MTIIGHFSTTSSIAINAKSLASRLDSHESREGFEARIHIWRRHCE